MDEKPKSVWKKSWKGLSWLRAWAILVIATFFILLIILQGVPGRQDWLILSIFGGLIIASVFVCLWAFFRWLCRWRNFKRSLFGCACLATLIALFYAEEDWRGKYDWEKFKREWEAKGERFDKQSFVPPPVPDNENFALTPIVFTSYGSMLTRDGKEIPYKDRDKNFVDRLAMNAVHDDDDGPKNGTGSWPAAKISDLKTWQIYYRSLARKTNEFPVVPQPQTPAQDVLLALSKYDSTIKELREAGRLPYSRFPLEYDRDDPWAILLPHLADLKRCSQVLQLRAIAELQNGQSDKARDDIQLMLRLVDSVHTEPFAISQLVRIAILQITLQPIYEGLAEHEWSDAQLVELNSELIKLDFLDDYKFAVRGEMVFSQGGMFDYLRHHPEQLINLSGAGFDDGNSPPLPGKIVARLIPSGWFYQNQLRSERFMAKFYLPMADVNQGVIFPSSACRADAAISAEFEHRNPYNIIEAIFLPSFGAFATRCAYAQSSTDLARVAIALERYRLAHGEYSDLLDALAPQFMEQVPHDVIDGGPLHYHRTSDGQFVLYSVGWNETDDGGVVVFKKGSMGEVDIKQGDWVWRYPER